MTNPTALEVIARLRKWQDDSIAGQVLKAAANLIEAQTQAAPISVSDQLAESARACAGDVGLSRPHPLWAAIEAYEKARATSPDVPAPIPLFSKKDLTFNEAFDRAQKAALDWLPVGLFSTALLREMRNGYAYGYAAALLAKDAHEMPVVASKQQNVQELPPHTWMPQWLRELHCKCESGSQCVACQAADLIARSSPETITGDDHASLRRECVELAGANAVSVAGCAGWPSSALLAFKLLCHRSALKSNEQLSVPAGVRPTLSEPPTSLGSTAGTESMSISKGDPLT